MKFRVTKQDIKSGQKLDKECCPIGLALARRGCQNVTVDTDAVFFELNKDKHAVPLPVAAKVFIAMFDSGVKVEPFTLELSL